MMISLSNKLVLAPKFITLNEDPGKMISKLPNSFFEGPDVVAIAHDLIGRILLTTFDGVRTSGRIVETEAYNGVVDRASHAYNGRRTARTSVMYLGGGVSYVYLCYGIHHLFNVVTNVEGIPHAVLIRAIEPFEGVETMLARLNKPALDHSVGRGPGIVSKALGITTAHTGLPFGDTIGIYSEGQVPGEIIASKRIGVDYAGPDANLPYRFHLKGNPFVSGSKRLFTRRVK